jgi:hypothetical protein
VVNLPNGTNTITLTVADHAGKVIRTNDASLVITLPTISASATDTGDTANNCGAVYTIFVETSATALSVATDGTDKFVGSICLIDTDSSGAMFGYAPGGTNDFINMNGSTTGGVAGSWVRITALNTAKYMVEGVLLATGTPATPFADS